MTEANVGARKKLPGMLTATVVCLLLLLGLFLAVESPVAGAASKVSSAGLSIAPESATRYITTGGADAGNDCLDSVNPCRTAQWAVDQASRGDLIKVAAGVFTDSETVTRGALTQMDKVGGDPRFATQGDGSGAYHIRSGSAALDAGIDTGLDKDIDGEDRPGGLGFDIGADEAGLLVHKSSQPAATVAAGGIIRYTIDYGNSGQATASAFRITDTLPANATLLVDSISAGGVVSGNQVIWNLGDLPGGASGQTSVKVQVNTGLASGTAIVNTARLASAEFAPVDSGDVVVTTALMPDFGLSTLTLTPAAPNPLLQPGDLLTYEVNYRNNGTMLAFGATITATVPATRSTSQVAATTRARASSASPWAIWPWGPAGRSSSPCGLLQMFRRASRSRRSPT